MMDEEGLPVHQPPAHVKPTEIAGVPKRPRGRQGLMQGLFRSGRLKVQRTCLLLDSESTGVCMR